MLILLYGTGKRLQSDGRKWKEGRWDGNAGASAGGSTSGRKPHLVNLHGELDLSWSEVHLQLGIRHTAVKTKQKTMVYIWRNNYGIVLAGLRGLFWWWWRFCCLSSKLEWEQQTSLTTRRPSTFSWRTLTKSSFLPSHSATKTASGSDASWHLSRRKSK